MSFLTKLFASPEAKAGSVAGHAEERAAVSYDIELVPNAPYRLTRQMYLFPEQEVSANVNDYLLIDSVVTYLESGGTLEDGRLIAPWVRVRSLKGKEGWCFAHYLAPATEEDLAKASKKRKHTAKGPGEHWESAAAAITIWNAR